MNDLVENAVIQREPSSQVPAVTPMALIERAMASGASMEQLTQLLDLKERWDAAEAKKAFTEAMAAFKADPPTILKTKKVNIPGGAKFAHATLADVCDGVCAALGRHGLSHKWETAQADGLITVTCILTHRLGHSERTVLTASPDDSGKKNGIQQIASTVTYLERYTLMAATGLGAKDMDDDGRGAGSTEAGGLSEHAYIDHLQAIESATDDISIDAAWDAAAKACHATQDPKSHAALKGKVIARKAALKARP